MQETLIFIWFHYDSVKCPIEKRMDLEQMHDSDGCFSSAAGTVMMHVTSAENLLVRGENCNSFSPKYRLTEGIFCYRTRTYVGSKGIYVSVLPLFLTVKSNRRKELLHCHPRKQVPERSPV